MADGSPIGNFFIRLSTIFDPKGLDEAKSKISDALDPLQGMRDVLNEIGLITSAGAAIWGLVDFSKESVRAFSENETAVKRLQIAMGNLGVYTKEALDKQVEFSEALAATSIHSANSILETQALLTSAGLYGAQLDRVTKAALDLSAGGMVPLHTATMLLAKAFDGNTNGLGRFNLKIEQTGFVARDFEQVMKKVEERFGGTSAQLVDTYAGRVAVLEHNFEALKVKIGAELVPVAEAWLGWIRRAIAAADDAARSDTDALKGHELTIQALRNRRDAIAATLAPMEQYQKKEDLLADSTYVSLKKQLDSVNKALEREGQLMDEQSKREASKPKPKFAPDSVTPEQKQKQLEYQKFLSEQDNNYKAHLEKEYEQFSFSEGAKADFEAMSLANRLEMEGQHDKATEVMDALKLKRMKQTNEELKKNYAETFAYIATLQNAKTRELVYIGKAAAIASATIHAHEAFVKTLAFFPAPINYALAGAVLAAAMAQIGQIAGVEMAEGGTLKANTGGTLGILAEAGRDEMAIPLDDPQTKRRLADTILPAGVTPADLVAAVRRGSSAPSAARGGAGGAGHIEIKISQENNINPGAGAPSVEQIMDQIRIKTRDGVVEALDMAKQVYQTALDRVNEA